MRKETITTKAGQIERTEEWARLSDINPLEVWGNNFGYYIEVSKEGKTRAIVLGEEISDKYNLEGQEVMDFKPVDYYNSGLRDKIKEKLKRDDTLFL